ncbi:hypothetical protein [Streptomyces sp. CC228A]|uniref:hypothetical protein n=1 Tax=Streptomyces sp. CC228A TaxID=2898186 RepID=UPI001F3F7480|nr:hypothetical protein [Streptomyces sp. CC228A]
MQEPVDSVETEELDTYDAFDMVRVVCPDCAQSIALLADEDALPEHALCPTPWNPFVLSVCAGSGRPASDAYAPDEAPEAVEQEFGVLLTLPQELDWRTQPFSHVGGPGSRPIKVPQMRRAPELRRAA